MSSSKVSRFWQKHIPISDGDAWLEKLSYLPSDRLVLIQHPGGKLVNIEYYAEKVSEIRKLIGEYGGVSKSVSRKEWIATQERHFELPVRPFFCIASDKDSVSTKNKNLPTIVIPANMAFGTGEHATTSMCLHAVAYFHRKYPHGEMLDVGTGSGILALAGALLGLKVQAIDLDPECIREAKANAQRNPSIPRVSWEIKPVEKFSISTKFDMIVGNLYSECIIGALPRLKRHLKKNGVMILSGILKSQHDDVIEAVQGNGLAVQSVKSRGKWVCVVASL